MKKFISLTLIYLIAFALFSQSDTTGINMMGDTLQRNSTDDAETMFELGVGKVVVMGRGDTLNLDGPTVLSNGQPLGADPVINTSVYNVLRSYDAEQREATGSDDYMFIDAFSKAKEIWIPNDVLWTVTGDAQYLISGTVEIPFATELIFDIGAKIDVTGHLKGTYTYIKADIHQIFTVTSNLSTDDYDWASSNVPRPEWFGAGPAQYGDARDAIQKCADVFKRNILLDGAAYIIDGTIELNGANTLKIAPLTVIRPLATNPDAPLFKITAEPFIIDGGLIQVPPGYHGWIFEIDIDDEPGTHRNARFSSAIKNIIIEGQPHNSADYAGRAYKGIRIRSDRAGDYSYFSVVDAVDFYRPDTAIYVTSHPTSGMNNSWHWSNISIDGTMSGIILGERAAGHVFSNLVIQPNTKQMAASDGVTPYITVHSLYNVFTGMIWDVPKGQKVIKIGPKAAHNWFNSFGHYNLYNEHVLDLSRKPYNTFSTANPFEAADPGAHNYVSKNSLSIGKGSTENSRYAGPLTLYRDIAIAKHPPTLSVITKTTSTGGPLTGALAATRGISIITQKTNGAYNNRGHGGGIEFLSKHTASDTITPTKYRNNIMARLYGRKDKSGAENDNKGLFQIFTKGENAILPTMTLRNSGFVGIGTTDPKSTLQVNGGIQVGDDTDAASVDKVGTVRYRSDSNNSYIEMCVQTDASTYAWVILHQETW